MDSSAGQAGCYSLPDDFLQSLQPLARKVRPPERAQHDRPRAAHQGELPDDDDRADGDLGTRRRGSENAADDLHDDRQQPTTDLLKNRLERGAVLALRTSEEERPALRPLGGESFEKG